MEKNNHKNIFNPNQLERLDKFAELIYFENKKYNLTGLKNVKDIKNVLISESIRAINYPNLNLTDSIKVIDIGTGAGIPGIPLKIVKDDVNLTLVDSNNKKCDFLKMVSSKLNISTKVICSRIEDLAHNNDHREKYDLCLARALSNISTLNEFALPFLKLSGVAFYIKGKNISKEIIESEFSAKVLGGSLSNYSTVTDMSSIVIYNKVRYTPKSYPRKVGIPKKSPLELS
tara:strand:+ start:964 stop:1653 length:690 start_codon:yes stop_codon:yes gene_type:complete